MVDLCSSSTDLSPRGTRCLCSDPPGVWITLTWNGVDGWKKGDGGRAEPAVVEADEEEEDVEAFWSDDPEKNLLKGAMIYKGGSVDEDRDEWWWQ